MRYLLDTNAVTGLLNGTPPGLSRRIRAQMPAEVGISAVVAHELYYGAFRSQRAAANVAVVDGLRLAIVEFDREDARAAGEIRAGLARLGTPIGPDDVLIAGQALARGLVLVTGNTGEFARVPGLRIEDWSA